ncbi:MAG: BspA family leucine-rich repeat surface protein [Clostridia bacterium]|nr:BspA family leucine-rich repeat surface protein [Clostridia bacterium]
MRITKEIRGITLIALIITIIVLLILAGVALATLTGNTSIINNANNVVEKYNESANADDGVINKIEGIFSKYMEGDTQGGSIVDTQEDDVITPVYVVLYTDGTLAFNSTGKLKEGYTVDENYGDISNIEITNGASDLPWNDKRSNITIVDFENIIKPTTTRAWFYHCTNLTELKNMSNLNTSNVTNMRGMFNNCNKLTSIDVSSFNTNKVIDMNGMFDNCLKLTSLDVSNFNTSSVTDMAFMFAGEDSNLMSLLKIDGLNNFNTNKVTNMKAMFNNCVKLKSINLSSFDTSNVTDMSFMFAGYNASMSLDTIYISDTWKTNNVTSSSNMFQGCNSIRGQAGTTIIYHYLSSEQDKRYAHVDSVSNPGYLTHIDVNNKNNNIELSYIESTGTQYIDTKYYPNQNTKIDLVMESIDWGEYKNPFGVRTFVSGNTYKNRYAIWLYGNKSYFFHIGKDEEKKTATLNNSYTNTKFHLITENGKISIKDLKNNYDEEISTFDKVGEFKTDYSLLLGAITNGAEALNLCKYKIYSCKIYEGETLVRDYVPVFNTLSGRTGLYDNVEKIFYLGLGTGNFEFEHTETIDNTTNNTIIDSIETTGKEYIDTKYYPNQNTKIDLVMEFSNINNVYNILGERNSDFSAAFQIWTQNNGDISNRINTSEYNTFTPSVSINNSKISFHMEDGRLLVDNLTNNKKDEFTFDNNTNNFQATYSLLLGANNQDGSAKGYEYSYKIYSCKIYEGETIVRDYVPVYNNILKQKGLYDNVNNTFTLWSYAK